MKTYNNKTIVNIVHVFNVSLELHNNIKYLQIL